ncbi:MAG TPA: hypothetical protein VM925_29660, partial [Labilithrix sp.]|nr:hypothetical protein [Labilithrix sp.]
MRLRDSNRKSLVVGGVGSTWLFITALVACGVDSVGVPPVDSGTNDSGSTKNDAGGALVDSAPPSKDAASDAAVATYSIGGTVTGLAAGTADAGLEDAGTGGLVLQNGAETITVNANGSFTFASKTPANGAYDVTIAAQPTNPVHACTVSGGKGTVVAGNITSITVNCNVQTFTVGGSVSGLAGAGLQLRINDSENVAINVNDGTYAFPTALPSGTRYDVVVDADPTNRWQTCTVANGSGVVDDANVANVDISCSNKPFTVSGTISDLTASGMELTNTYSGGGGPETVTVPLNATTFAFTEQVRSGETFAVTLKTTPAGLFCNVTNGSGTIGGANVTGVSVTCEPSTFDLASTGAEQIFKIPAWGTAIDVTLEGAQGGSSYAPSTNYGGKLTATLAVTPGEELSIFVGGQPTG